MLSELIFGNGDNATASTADTASKGRFAPSPSGRMHLGNIYAALLSYLEIKSKGGKWVLRIEDNDPQRSKREFSEAILDDLQWLGLYWDEGPYYQSERDDIYEGYLKQLSEKGLIYPCSCTRAEIMATRAPHQSDGHVTYSGKCRPDRPIPDAWTLKSNLRLLTTKAHVEFDDLINGHQSVDIEDYSGDFILRRRDGAWAYQFAVTVDDCTMGITDVVRGDDLLLSTAPQKYLASLLGLQSPSTFLHLPLLVNSEGQRLSKRDHSTSMEWLRANSSPEAIIAHICRLSSLPFDKVMSLIDSNRPR